MSPEPWLLKPTGPNCHHTREFALCRSSPNAPETSWHTSNLSLPQMGRLSLLTFPRESIAPLLFPALLMTHQKPVPPRSPGIPRREDSSAFELSLTALVSTWRL